MSRLPCPRISKWLVLGCAILLPAGAGADWAWKNDQAVAKREKGALVAEFTFQNTGSSTVTVSDLQFACSCTEHQFSVTPAKPGKTGILKVTLPGDPAGTELEFVAFGTDDSTPAILRIQIPDTKAAD